ncbi:MAG: glycosyltransferase family 2 protein [Muribaculaceae bacterium]|nr:glycosyltransferase family 2 protein [Muribaculaceae bacterium]
MTNEPLVSIRCLVYNHEPYLRQCLDGFVMQQTNFPFEAIVHDDASTDGSAAIIREYAERYPDIIKPIYETENKYSQGYGKLNKIMIDAISPAAKYVAICEGDDYWTDSNKLQKQFDFMEAHPDYSMCFHPVVRLNEIDHSETVQENEDEDVSTEKIIAMGGSYCPTASIVIKKSILCKMPRFRQTAKVGDYPMQVLAATEGRIHCFPDVMGCWRCQPSSWTMTVHNKRLITHHLNRIEWLKECDDYTSHKYTSAVYYSIIDSALELFKQGAITRKEVLKMFSKVKLWKLDLDIQHKIIFIKQFLYILSHRSSQQKLHPLI